MSSAQLVRFSSVSPAQIEWRDDLPYSIEFCDVYFSIHGALEESKHVFIDGNDLLIDWANDKKPKFSIAELGFGSGLNFLNTAHHWIKHISSFTEKKQFQQLHYVSIEKRPFHLNDFKRVAKIWPQFNYISEILIQHYPSQTYGRHQITFSQWNLTLTLIFMPLDDALDDLINESESRQNNIIFDNWFLDGFAPNKNTSMWEKDNAIRIAKLSRIGTKLSTYSVASSVKKPLIEAGFEINKRKGFAKKREMLTAILTNKPNSPRPKFINLKYDKPWFNISSKDNLTRISNGLSDSMIENHSSSSSNSESKSSFNLKTNSKLKSASTRIAIIGGGIAGCTLAYSLTKKGFSCDIFESKQDIALAASGAAAGIFHPQLTSDMNIGSQFNWQAYLVLLNFLSELTDKERNSIILSQGINRFLTNSKLSKQILELSNKIGISSWIKTSEYFPKNDRCIYFPHAAAINMQAFCRLLIQKTPSQQLSIFTNIDILDLKTSEKHWKLISNERDYEYKQVVFCGGANSPLLEKLNISTSNISRGQTCYFQSKKIAEKINSTIMENIYLVPRGKDLFHLGTTFENTVDDHLNKTSQIDMLNRMSKFLKLSDLPYLSDNEIQNIELQGTLGYRLHTKDRMPLIGAAIDQEKLINDFKNLGQFRILRNDNQFYNLPGLWINTAYGSHGLLFSLLASEHLTSLIGNEISPLTSYLSQAIHPARFVVKKLRS